MYRQVEQFVLNKGKFMEQKVPLFSISTITNLGSVDGKKTKRCFIGDRWCHRDKNFDNLLGETQPSTGPCTIATLVFSQEWTFVETAATILGIGVDTDAKLLGQLLIKRGHTITLPQSEEMMEKTNRGEKTDMCTDGYGNFFFVETGNQENPVSLGRVYGEERAWFADIGMISHDRRWFAASRLLLRNPEALKP